MTSSLSRERGLRAREVEGESEVTYEEAQVRGGGHDRTPAHSRKERNHV